MQEKEYVSEYYPIILYYVIASEGLIYLFYNKEFIEPVNISHNGIHSTSINTWKMRYNIKWLFWEVVKSGYVYKDKVVFCFLFKSIALNRNLLTVSAIISFVSKKRKPCIFQATNNGHWINQVFQEIFVKVAKQGQCAFLFLFLLRSIICCCLTLQIKPVFWKTYL